MRCTTCNEPLRTHADGRVRWPFQHRYGPTGHDAGYRVAQVMPLVNMDHWCDLPRFRRPWGPDVTPSTLADITRRLEAQR